MRLLWVKTMEEIIYRMSSCSTLDGVTAHLQFVNIQAPSIVASLAGEGTLLIGSRSIAFSNVSLFFFRPGDSVQLLSVEGQPLVMYLIEYEAYRLKEVQLASYEDSVIYDRDRNCIPLSGYMVSKPSLDIIVLLEKLLLLQPSPLKVQADQENTAIHKFEKHQLLAKLMKWVAEQSEAMNMLLEPSVSAAKHYIEKNYMTDISRQQLAQLSGFNDSYFSTIFVKETGWSYSEYLNRIRMDRAKERLLGSSLTLQEIAGHVGYASGEYFSRKFKQQTGITPGAFRSLRSTQRIASFQFAGQLLALGVQPVAVDAELASYTDQLLHELQAIEQVDGDYDQLRGKVDLIIVPSYFYNIPGKISRLELIAPLLVLDWSKQDPISELRFLGSLLDREKQAEAWIKSYFEHAQKYRLQLQTLVDEKQTAALYEVRDDMIYIWDIASRGAFNLYGALNLLPPQSIASKVWQAGQFIQISEEEFPQYTADHMFIIYAGSANGHLQREDAAIEWLENFKKCIALGGCSNSRTYLLDLKYFWCSGGISLDRQLSIITEKIYGLLIANNSP